VLDLLSPALKVLIPDYLSGCKLLAFGVAFTIKSPIATNAPNIWMEAIACPSFILTNAVPVSVSLQGRLSVGRESILLG
jgi:hypothetical protein